MEKQPSLSQPSESLARTYSWLNSPMKGPRLSHRSEPFFIGVAGGTASGKSTVCDLITQRLQEQSVVMLAQDSFYRNLTPAELEHVQDYNFDQPEAFDTEAILECLDTLRAGQPVEVPIYDFTTHQRSTETRHVTPADVVVLEGILVLHEERIRERLNMKVYVDTDDDVRLARRIQRDVSVRGRDVGGVIEQYTQFVKPAFDQYVAPSRKFADVIIPWARGDNVVAIDLITEHIRMKLQQHDLRRIYPNLEVIPSNFQIRGMHTIIRDTNTRAADFVFYADRLLRLVVEAGLGHLPFFERTVVTPTGHQYVGVDFAKKLCGVSIIRSGESMENALRACCKGIKIGKILVHREKVWALRATDCSVRPSSSGGAATSSLPPAAAAAAGGGRESEASGPVPTAPPAAAAAGQCTPQREPQQSSQQGRTGEQSQQQQPAFGDPVATENIIKRRPSSGVGETPHRRTASGSAPGQSRLEQEIVYEKLPQDIAERYVLLMDPMLGTGKSAARAIKVLLEKGVEEGRILFLTLIAAPEGIHRVCRAYPRIKIITSEIDEGMEDLHVVPGVGEFGDRYFCD